MDYIVWGYIAIPVLCRCTECGRGQSDRHMGSRVAFKNEHCYQACFQIPVRMAITQSLWLAAT